MLTRVNLAVEDNHSFRDHVDAKRVFVAPSFSWQLDPDTTLLVESEFVRHSSTFDRGIVANTGMSHSTFLGEPNDGNIRKPQQPHSGGIGTPPQRRLETAPGQSLQTGQPVGRCFGKPCAGTQTATASIAATVNAPPVGTTASPSWNCVGCSISAVGNTNC